MQACAGVHGRAAVAAKLDLFVAILVAVSKRCTQFRFLTSFVQFLIYSAPIAVHTGGGEGIRTNSIACDQACRIIFLCVLTCAREINTHTKAYNTKPTLIDFRYTQKCILLSNIHSIRQPGIHEQHEFRIIDGPTAVRVILIEHDL